MTLHEGPDHLPDWAKGISSELQDKMGIEIRNLSPDRVVGTMPVAGNRQPYGLLHGGASAVLIEGLASMGAAAHAMTMSKIAVGIDLNVTHTRAVRDGMVTGVATPINLGRRLAVYTVELSDSEGRVTATGRLTCQLLERR